MTESTNSQLDFIHKPNTFISFVNYQCTLEGDPIRIPSSEQELMDQVVSPESKVITRFKGRQTGGSTLMALALLYYLLQGKEVLFTTENDNMKIHFLHHTLGGIEVLGFKKVMDKNSWKMRLVLEEDTNRCTNYATFRSGPYSGRGHSTDVMICDGYLTRRKNELDELIACNAPCIADKDGKLIINVTM